ncbi:GDP-mannose 4,6-dehydratase [Parasediminibacterium paludis]|uniref:GDP-mannose 4,6-dehydratase n=1 Tax=Parasediminibacterium paludis TaxID=908966 RepID=A0ABV8Q2F0_9BACT
MMKTAFITGITGQDGAYLSKLLLENGYTVIGIVRNIQSKNIKGCRYLDVAENIIFEEADLLDLSRIVKLIHQYQPSEIYHLAAQSSVGTSFKEPRSTLYFNINSTINFLEAIRSQKPDCRFYNASSSEMFGKVDELPIKINTPMHPLSPYAVAKASTHWSVVNYREAYKLFVVNGILFNHESYLRHENFFVKKVIMQAVINKDNPNWILKVGNIDVKRDFGYSPEYVNAMWLMLQQSVPKDYMICTGKSITLRSIIEYVFKKLQIDLSKLQIEESLFRPSDIIDIYGDNSNAVKDLKWKYTANFFEVIDQLIDEEIANL